VRAHPERGDRRVALRDLCPDHADDPRHRSEVRVGRREGLPATSVITCDNPVTIGKARLDEESVGHLGREKRLELDRALRYALDIQY
jgi:mRNA-degrading endonuclease toxin of MazEF toxin-antitoxin module